MFNPNKGDCSLKSKVSNEKARSKGKGIAGNLDSSAAPPLPLSSSNGGELDRDAEDMKASKRFKDEGLLDESVFDKEDRAALASRILELENYLRAYQYSMGLLVVEKKEWCSEFEEMKARLAEAEDVLNGEQAAHNCTLTKSKKREDKLHKALIVDKQYISDLEKALNEKNVKIERKLDSADAKLAEANRKSSDIDRKLEDFYSRERRVQREIISIRKKLQDGQNVLLNGQRYNNEREKRINEAERAFKQKEEELEEAKISVEGTRSTLKSKEEDLESRLSVLAAKEKKIELIKKKLLKKEKELLETKEKLNNHEREEIQKLLDEHNATLDTKNKEFELELESKRKSFDEELKGKFAAVNKIEKEIKNKEKLISMREIEFENKMDRIKIEENELETKSKALKKWEETLKSDEKKLIVEKDQIMKNMHDLNVSINEHQSLRDALKAQEHQIAEEREKLEISKEEREQYMQKQSELNKEIEEYMSMKEELSKEIESPREEREKFEKDRKSLDEKKIMLQIEQNRIHRGKEEFALQKKEHQDNANGPAIDVVRVSEHSSTLAAMSNVQNETEGSSFPTENDSSAKQRRQSIRRGREAKLVRSLDIKAAVEDTKAILGEISNGEDTKESAQQIDDESQGASVYAGVTYNTRQKKRQALASEMTNSEINAEERRSQSQTIYIGEGTFKKRRISTTSSAQALVGEGRYNLRCSTIAKHLAAATQVTSDQAKEQTAAKHQA